MSIDIFKTLENYAQIEKAIYKSEVDCKIRDEIIDIVREKYISVYEKLRAIIEKHGFFLQTPSGEMYKVSTRSHRFIRVSLKDGFSMLEHYNAKFREMAEELGLEESLVMDADYKIYKIRHPLTFIN